MFELGPFALRYYGLCIALGIIVAGNVHHHRHHRRADGSTFGVNRLGRLYAGPYATPAYVTAVRGVIDMLQQRYDVSKRPPRGSMPSEVEEDETNAAEQTVFEWK